MTHPSSGLGPLAPATCRSLLLALGVCLSPAVSDAQAPAVGQRVRVTAPRAFAGRPVGRVERVDRDSLIWGTQAGRWAVPPALVDRLEVSRGSRRRWAEGLMVGAAVGLAAGAILLSPGSTACTGSGDYEKYCRYYRAAILLGAAGLGAGTGALIRTERWATVSLDSLPAGRPERQPAGR